jgi:hypothetical protein
LRASRGAAFGALVLAVVLAFYLVLLGGAGGQV